MYAKYHDPSSIGSPDILLKRFHWFKMQKPKKEHNSAMSSPMEKVKKIWVRLLIIFIL